jgi:hypothetical protein
MRKPWIAAALVLGIGMLALTAQQQQQIQKPPVQQKQIDKTKGPMTPYGMITINSPKSGSKPWFAGGSFEPIVWTKAGVQPANVKIELRDQNCQGGVLVIEESTPNDGSHSYAVPASVPDGPYTIRISGTGVERCSERFDLFAVPWKITVPANTTWKIGSMQTVTWTSTEPAGATVDLFLIPSGDVKGIPGALNTPNDGSQTIKVPAFSQSKIWIAIVAQFRQYGKYEFRGGPITIVP